MWGNWKSPGLATKSFLDNTIIFKQRSQFLNLLNLSHYSHFIDENTKVLEVKWLEKGKPTETKPKLKMYVLKTTYSF